MARDEHNDAEADAERLTRGLGAIVFVLLLALAGSYLVKELKKEGQIEDCLLAHRMNCDALSDDR
jgi:hypothetical protein